MSKKSESLKGIVETIDRNRKIYCGMVFRTLQLGMTAMT